MCLGMRCVCVNESVCVKVWDMRACERLCVCVTVFEFNFLTLENHGFSLTIHFPTPSHTQDYSFAKKLGIYREVQSHFTLTVSEIVDRISKSRDQYLSKFTSKQAKEKEYYDERYQRSLQKEG